MKQTLLAILLCSTVLLSVAQSDKYTAAMKKAFTLFDSAKSVTELQSAAGMFERIGDAEKTQWLPYYYAALAQATIGWRPDVKDKDANAEKIKALLEKGKAIETNSELLTIENMMNTQQMMVDPQTRWQTYGQQAAAALQQGMKLDPNNPRLYYLQGMSIFNTPTQFGGGKDKAKPIFEKALALYKAAQPKPMYPHWGQKQTEDMIAQCQ